MATYPQTPLRVKITLAVVSILTQIFAQIVGLRNWYRDCLSISRKQALVVVFMPLLIGLLILFLLGIGIMPLSLSDEVWTVGGLVATALMYVATVQQLRGKCDSQKLAA